MAHTPGPWSWWTSNSWKRLRRDDHGISQPVLEPYVCSDGHPDCTVSPADMALISAAPDLLKALQEMIDLFAPTIEDPEQEWMCVQHARAAIRKATS